MKIPALLLLTISASLADKLLQADIGKLSDPAARDGEVSRLTIDDDKWALVGFHFLNAPQRDGKPPLHVLAAERDYIGTYVSDCDYRIEEPEELFTPVKTNVRARTEPTLDAIRDSALMVFGPDGKETRPFGGNNYMNFGYLFDFDGDGILDRADSTNYGLENAEKHRVQVFKLESVEPNPRMLLRVIFNFHPRSADDANDWTSECFDENSDGIPEIAFGPDAGDDTIARREIVFRFDKATGTYMAGDLPENAHVRVIAADDSLETIAKAGGLGYPLIEKGGTALPSPAEKEPYEFRSLKGLPIAEIAAFFQGKDRRDAFAGAEGSFPNRIPENFFGMSPKEAALALAESNRTEQHRAGYQLAIDDRKGVAPPTSGWISYAWDSSGCYSSSSEVYSIHFGGRDPVLIVYGDNNIGYVGRNRWADQPAHNARLISLSEKEAGFLAETLFWLDRVRSRALPSVKDNHSSSSSTADGYASISLFPDSAAPSLLASGTAWATSSISGSWVDEYDPTIFVNLAGLLVRESIPQILGNRWETTRDITPHSLATPTGERLQPRVDDSEREQLAAIYSDILEMHFDSPIPASVLSPLCGAAGAEALVSLLPALEKLHASLPAPDEDEEEYRMLSQRFARDHFGNHLADEPAEHKKAYARLEKLREKLRYHPALVLRNPLEATITRLRLAADPEKLKQSIIDESPEKDWSLTLLRRNDPAAWAIFVSADFGESQGWERSAMLSTLAAGHPPAAAEIIRNLSPGEKAGLVLLIAAFHQEHEPAKLADEIPVILGMIRDRNADYSQRDAAMQFLAGIPLLPEALADFRNLLVSEIKNPVEAKEIWRGNSIGTAVSALTQLPNPEQHLELIMDTPGIGKSAFGIGFKALAEMTAKSPEREHILSGFLRPQLTESKGMMNGVFAKALAHNLHSLAPEIAAFASASPDVEDGDGANYSGGNFKSPVGQRYHITREITALWSEEDPATLAKMWIAFVSARPNLFDDQGSLRPRAEKHIMALPLAERKDAIAEISAKIPVPEYHAKTINWLSSLNQ